MSGSILFICLSALFVAGSALQLTRLCSERVYGTGTINSFYRLQSEKTLEPIARYLVDVDHPNYDQYEEVLGSVFVNTSDLFEIMAKFELVKNESTPSIKPLGYGFRSRRSWIRPQTVDYREANLRSLKLVFKSLEENRITKELISTSKLAKELSSVQQPQTNQRSVFQNKFLNVFYKKAIAQFDSLIVQRNQSLYLDDSTTAKLRFSLYIPFYQSGAETVKMNCVGDLGLLPKFYAQETTPAINEDENLIDPEFNEASEIIKETLESLTKNEWKMA